MTAEQRFREKVAPANAAGCQLWTASTDDGYGKFRVGGRSVLAHRFAWELVNGPIPEGLCVCHHCDIRACVCREHLFLGTNADNAADREAKGRSADHRGSKSNFAKLTEVEAVGVFLASGTQKTIAANRGVSQQLVSNIKRRKNWAHATAGLQ